MNIKTHVYNIIQGILALRDLARTCLHIPYSPRPRIKLSRRLMSIVALSVKHIHGPKRIVANPNDVIVVCPVRDGEEYIRTFIDYHFALGVKHIVFLDNHSQDATVKLACSYPNVTVLHTALPFRTYAHDLKAYLKVRFARNCWCLYLDIDELFDYPFSDRVSLAALLRYLNVGGYNVVLANMLEMFSSRSLDELETIAVQDIRREYRFYDLTYLRKRPLPRRINRSSLPFCKYKHGIRTTAFGCTFGRLDKNPLFFSDTDLNAKNVGTHNIIGKGAKLANFSCVLFHYQFTGSLRKRCLKAIEEKNYHQDSNQYNIFYEALTADPHLNVKERAKEPQEFKHTNELIEKGFLIVSDEFTQYADQFSASNLSEK